MRRGKALRLRCRVCLFASGGQGIRTFGPSAYGKSSEHLGGRDTAPARNPGWRAALGERFSAYQVEQAGAAATGGGDVPASLSATIEISPEKTDLSAPNGGERRHTLISAEISLIADLNSLQDRAKNSLFGCVGNWLVKP